MIRTPRLTRFMRPTGWRRVSSAVMPAAYRDRLTALCAPISQIEVVFADTQDLRAVVAPYIQDPSLEGQSLIQFRIDDDDALSARYVARLRDWAGYVRDQMIICFPLGIMLYSDAEGAKCDLMMRNLTAVGFAFHTKGPTDRTPLMFSHVQAGRRYPYVVDTSIAAYIQTFTASSDTAGRIARKLPEFRRKAALRTPARTAEALPNKLRKHFPTLKMADLLALQTRVQGNLQPKNPKEATQ